MSKTLAGGEVWIKTRAGVAATREGPFHQFLMDGSGADIQVALHEATDAIYELTHAPETFDEPVMQGIRSYIRGLNLVTVEGSDGQGRPMERYEPSDRGWREFAALRTSLSAPSDGEAVDFMGVELEPADFASLVDYVMTNTVLWSEDAKAETEDPRVAMIEKFRGN